MEYDATQIGHEVELERRRVLWGNGYKPVPLNVPAQAWDAKNECHKPDHRPTEGTIGSKIPALKGWLDFDYDDADPEDTVLRWALIARDYHGTRQISQTTGIQKPVGLDIDICGVEERDFVMGKLRTGLGALLVDDMLLRTGKAAKVCLLARKKGRSNDTKFFGKVWVPADGSDDKAQIEVFDGQGQIGVSGVHTYAIEQVPQGFFGPKLHLTPHIVYDWVGPLSASLEMLGAITRGMIAWHDKSELGQLAAVYRRERKLDAKKGGHAEHRTKMYQTNMKMQNILATMWKECE